MAEKVPERLRWAVETLALRPADGLLEVGAAPESPSPWFASGWKMVKTRAAVLLLADHYNRYEFELKRNGGRWYLEQLFYVDEEGGWPEL